MEPYKPKSLPFDYQLNNSTLKLLMQASETYGEYKGYLKNMNYNYRLVLENFFNSELYYSFKIDGSKTSKEYMFYNEYIIKNNESTQFENAKKDLYIGVNSVSSSEFSLNIFNKLNKTLFLNCSKNNKTKNSGKLRTIQNYILKPGIAGSSVSFIPPVYSELNKYMNNLIQYMNNNEDQPLISTIITHFQYEKLHPYVSGNGKLGRLLIPIQYSYYNKEIPLLFISESLDNYKNTYFTLLSQENADDVNGFIKFMLQCIIDQCNLNIKKIKLLNKIYLKDYESFKTVIGGTTIYKVYPVILKKVVFTTSDLVKECNLHINSVNKVINKLVNEGYLIKEKKKGTNRVTFCYKAIYDVFTN